MTTSFYDFVLSFERLLPEVYKKCCA